MSRSAQDRMPSSLTLSLDTTLALVINSRTTKNNSYDENGDLSMIMKPKQR